VDGITQFPASVPRGQQDLPSAHEAKRVEQFEVHLVRRRRCLLGKSNREYPSHSWPHEPDSYEALFLVDTGATDSMAPGDELEKIGVPKQSRMAYELADGTVKDYSFGIVKIEFMGEITAGRIIFGDKDIEPILGVTAFESVGILVDPVKKTLKRLPAIPLKHIA
jgi:clan AA aspartic protease